MPTSYPDHREFTRKHLMKNWGQWSTILDVGAGCGDYFNLLNDCFTLDAVEVHRPYIDHYHLESKYRRVFNNNILEWMPDFYDVIIMGDVLEHFTVKDAQSIVRKMLTRCHELLVIVPYEYEQEDHPVIWENHLQPDLTPAIMASRYPKLFPIEMNERQGVYTSAKDIL